MGLWAADAYWEGEGLEVGSPSFYVEMWCVVGDVAKETSQVRPILGSDYARLELISPGAAGCGGGSVRKCLSGLWLGGFGL